MNRCYCCDCLIPYPLKDYQDPKLPERSYCILCWIEILEVILMQDPKKAEEYLPEETQTHIPIWQSCTVLDPDFETLYDTDEYFSEPVERHLLPYGDEDLQGYNDEDLIDDYRD